MNCIVFVTARTASTRLPKKALLEINHKPLIMILLGRVQNCRRIKKAIVCTTKERSDNKLVKILKNEGIEVFRGDSRDILSRLYKAAKLYEASQFVVVEGDDVFCEPRLIDETCKKLSTGRYDFLHWEGLPFGVSPLGIKTSKLEKLIRAKKTRNTETGWGKFIISSGFFKVGKLRPPSKKWTRPEIRLSVDYPQDFDLVKKIYKKLPSRFSLGNIIDLLDKNPRLMQINESVKEDYMRNFEKKMTKIALKNRKRGK